MPDEHKYTLVVLDTPGIQRYIFSSNRLRENVGASHLVYLASTCWPLEILHRMGRSNVNADLTLDENKHIEDGNLDAEVIYVGGGNVTLLFRDKETARKFVRAWSRKVISEAPGLTPAAILEEYQWNAQDKDKNLPAVIDKARKKLKQARQSTPPSVPLLGLGVTVEGGSTGKPAVVMSGDYGDPRNRPVSAEVAAKLGRVEEANERLIRTFFDQDAGNAFPCKTACRDPKRNYDYTFPLQTDHFGRTRDERSYLAIVHADGNGVGDFFRRIGEEHAGNARAYIQAVRDASQRLRRASGKALCQVIQLLCKIDVQTYRDEKGIDLVKDEPTPGKPWKPAPGCNPTRQRDCYFLPFRPIVFGGDDFTFISDGRLGLTLAARYLEFFEKAAEKYDLPLKASAGIAIVKVHYPFARAYRLSETLTASAKHAVDRKCSALDWHIVSGGMLASPDDIRREHYTVSAGKLYVRPLALHDEPCGNFPRWRNWKRFKEVVRAFQKVAEEHRNKIIALREKLRQGPEAADLFLQWMPDKDELAWPQVPHKGGWTLQSPRRCLYFDPIEVMDFYVEVE